VNVVPAIVNVPCRAVEDVCGETVNRTVPLPLPLVPAVIAIQAVVVAAVHPHDPPAVTVTVASPPVAGNVSLDRSSDGAHARGGGGGGGGGAGGGGGGGAGGGGASACVTDIVWPATVAVPDRRAPELADTTNLTAPSPSPAVAPLIRIHALVASAVQRQPVIARTCTRTSPPADGAVDVVGVTVKTHGAGSCAIATWALFTSSIVRRADGARFDATR
jgi:hypothetical protein